MSNRRLSDRAWFDEHVKIIKVDVPAPLFEVVAGGTATVDADGDVTLDITPVRRHDPYDECDGLPLGPNTPFGRTRCVECNTDLCGCELAYGHDCE